MSTSSTKDHYQILILGGGTAGITVAAQLRRKLKTYDLAIIEPSTKHYYQPLWTLVGAGVFPKEQSEREETFPFDQSKERLSMYLLKAYALPPVVLARDAAWARLRSETMTRQLMD